MVVAWGVQSGNANVQLGQQVQVDKLGAEGVCVAQQVINGWHRST